MVVSKSAFGSWLLVRAVSMLVRRFSIIERLC